MAAGTDHAELALCFRCRAACGDESFLRREVRYEPDVRGTIGCAKILRFPRVNVTGAPGTCAISVGREQLRDVATRTRSSLGRRKELFQRGKMRPTPNASSTASARHVRAVSQARCRNIHKPSAIRLPPGRMSANAEYDTSSRIERRSRTLQLVLLGGSSRMV
jgi:hypothetical protein